MTRLLVERSIPPKPVDSHAQIATQILTKQQTPDGRIRAGHSIVGVPHRGTAKGGMITADIFARAAGGGGFCYQHFLQKIPSDKVDPTAIPEEQAAALMAYFEHVSGDNKGPPVPDYNAG